jgi:hypothetical protein
LFEIHPNDPILKNLRSFRQAIKKYGWRYCYLELEWDPSKTPTWRPRVVREYFGDKRMIVCKLYNKKDPWKSVMRNYDLHDPKDVVAVFGWIHSDTLEINPPTPRRLVSK